jgi:hypothetical protein
MPTQAEEVWLSPGQYLLALVALNNKWIRTSSLGSPYPARQQAG